MTISPKNKQVLWRPNPTAPLWYENEVPNSCSEDISSIIVDEFNSCNSNVGEKDCGESIGLVGNSGGTGVADIGGVSSPTPPYFHHLKLKHSRQYGPTCVPTTLAMIARATGAKVTTEDMKSVINTQAPHTWSNALKPFGLQLAYCNSDQRRIQYFIDELVALDDLFLLSFYSRNPPSDPNSEGKLCTAHIITLHRDTIFDTAKDRTFGEMKAVDYERLERETKRIFRVVPLGHPRCI